MGTDQAMLRTPGSGLQGQVERRLRDPLGPWAAVQRIGLVPGQWDVESWKRYS